MFAGFTKSSQATISSKFNQIPKLRHLLISQIASVLTEICNETSKRSCWNTSMTSTFMSHELKSIPIKKYWTRLINNTKTEAQTWIVMLIYIDKLCRINKYQLNYSNIHKIILGGLIWGIKFNEDKHITNEMFAQVGCVTWEELNNIEYNFFRWMQFNWFINKDTYGEYLKKWAHIFVDYL